MAHDGNHRRTRLLGLFGIVIGIRGDDVDIAFGNALIRWPNSSTSISAVSASIVWLTVTIMSMLNSAFTRSAPFSAMRLASSWMVIASGTITSRTCFSRGALAPPPWDRRSFSARTLERGEAAGTRRPRPRSARG